MKPLRAPTQEQAGVLMAVLAVLFGSWVRLLIPRMAGFPVNDGGLFYVMLRGVLENGLRIPPSVQYNGMHIPFAYPPLGFYAGALSALVFRVDPIEVLQWLPAVVLIGTLPAFYLLARAILGTSFSAGLAMLVYAFTPRAITWQVMGGGLTRSFGQVFLILAVAFIYRTFTQYRRRNLLLAIVFSALVVFSHPEAALQTVVLGLILWLLTGRTRLASVHALWIGAGTLLLTSIWWLPVIVSHGASTLLSAAGTGQFNPLFVFQPFLLSFVDEPLLSLISVFGLVGFAAELARRRWLLPLAFVLPFIAEPRSAPTISTIPLAMAAAVALADVILPALGGFGGAPSAQNLLRRPPVMLFLAFIGLYMLGNASYFGSQMAGTVLTPKSREAFAWIKDNTPEGSRFLVLTRTPGTPELFCDSAAEWFPALTSRTSLTTVQGTEWQHGAEFGALAAAAQGAAGCSESSSPLRCVEELSSGMGSAFQYDYLYVARTSPELLNCRTVGRRTPNDRLIAELQASSSYFQVFDNDAAVVFRMR